MNAPEQDQPDAQRAVDAVRAADPAGDSTPDLARLRAALTEATGVAFADEPVDELAARRGRRTPRWIQVAAAVAGVALVGGGGYALGTQHDDTVQAAGDIPAAVVLEPQRGASEAAADSRELAFGTPASPQAGRGAPQALGGPAALGTSDAKSSMIAPWYGGRTTFTAKGLSSAGGSRDAWAYDAASVYSASTATRLAKALGVQGHPHEEWGWTVGPNDGTAASLTLAPDGTASMSYYDPTLDPWACETRSAPDTFEKPSTDDASGDLSTGIGGDAAPGDDAAPACDPAQAPKGVKAEAEAKDAIASLGVDTRSLVLEAQQDSDDAVTTVVAYPVVGGQRTDLPWSVSLVADGVYTINGPVAPLVALGSYDVVSPAQAVERLGDPRFGSTSAAIPYAAREGVTEPALGSVATAPSEQPTVPPTVQPGSRIGWPVTEVTITQARLGLATHTDPNGATTLVPSYELTGSDRSTWGVIAIVDQQLDMASR